MSCNSTLFLLPSPVRAEEDDFLWPFCLGYLVLYHSLLFSPCFDIGVPVGKISGVFPNPGILKRSFSVAFCIPDWNMPSVSHLPGDQG